MIEKIRNRLEKSWDEWSMQENELPMADFDQETVSVQRLLSPIRALS